MEKLTKEVDAILLERFGKDINVIVPSHKSISHKVLIVVHCDTVLPFPVNTLSCFSYVCRLFFIFLFQQNDVLK